MNHLEPLSWHASPASAPSGAHAREVLARQHPSALLSLSIRSTFRVIAKLLEDCRKSTPPTHLAVSVNAVAELARITFAVAAGRPWCGALFRYDRDRYRDSLERLGCSLSAGATVPASELAHALDTLIVLLVQLDHANEEEAGLKPPHRSDGHLMEIDLSAPLKRGDRFPRVPRFECTGGRGVTGWAQQPRDAAVEHKP